MIRTFKPQTTLAIESAIQGGSISLLQGEKEIANWVGESSVSRAEDLLPVIQKLLEAHKVATNEIDLIAVSTGPGSYTGIRIGLSTALGLKNALNVRCKGISALEAMRLFSGLSTGSVAAVPMGRGMICLQKFLIDSDNAPELLTESAFREMLDTERSLDFVIHGSLCGRFQDLFDPLEGFRKTINAGYNIARLVGTACRSDLGAEDMTPLFVNAV